MTNLILKRPLIFLDCETTGTDTKTDRIVELAMTKILPDGRRDRDTGVKRAAIDVLNHEGMAQSTSVVATARLAMFYDRFAGSEGWKRGDRFLSERNQPFDDAAIVEFVHENEVALSDVVREAARSRVIGLPRGEAAFLLYEARLTDPVAADLWWSKLGRGVGLEEGESCQQLRKRLETADRSASTLKQEERLALAIKSYVWTRHARIARWCFTPAKERFPLFSDVPGASHG